MERTAGGAPGDAVAGLIVGDENGQYFAIAWKELWRYRVPEAWMAAVAALVRGAEPPEGGDDVRSHSDVRSLSAEHPVLMDAVTTAGRLRLGARRLEAWTLLR